MNQPAGHHVPSGAASSEDASSEAVASRPINPVSIAPPAANYAHAVLTTGATHWLHTSGVVPVGPDGVVPNDLLSQAQTIWSNISAMLAEAGMSLEHIVSVTTYVVPGLELGPVMAVRDQRLGGRLVASTLLIVPELAQDAWKMEIAVIAAA
jgi:enamine deaminase RidA (YjgF/YER057c/UK114 family)